MTDGKTALDYLRESQNKAEELVAIFLDLKLPTMNEIEVLKSIRTDKRLKGLPIIVMTSSHVRQDLPRTRGGLLCTKTNLAHYLRKGYRRYRA